MCVCVLSLLLLSFFLPASFPSLHVITEHQAVPPMLYSVSGFPAAIYIRRFLSLCTTACHQQFETFALHIMALWHMFSRIFFTQCAVTFIAFFLKRAHNTYICTSLILINYNIFVNVGLSSPSPSPLAFFVWI